MLRHFIMRVAETLRLWRELESVYFPPSMLVWTHYFLFSNQVHRSILGDFKSNYDKTG